MMLSNKGTFHGKVQDILSQSELEWLKILKNGEQATFTFGDLSNRISAFCAFYKERKLEPGDVVLIILKESPDLFASFFAGILSGLLPAYWAYPSQKQTREAFHHSLENLIKFNRIKIIITYSELAPFLEKTPWLNRLPGFEGIWDAKKLEFTVPQTIPEYKGQPEAFLQFSSGTTGSKKGVKISTRSLLNQIEAYAKVIDYREDSRIVSWLPHYHDMGLIACMLIPFLKKTPIVMMSPFEWVRNPGLLFEAIEKYRCTHVWLPNFALGHLTQSVPDSKVKNTDLDSLAAIICCSEPVLYDTVQQFIEKFSIAGLRSSVLYNCYAMAENTFAMSSGRGGGIRFLDVDSDLFKREGRIRAVEKGYKIASTGIPLDNLSVKIVNPQNATLGEDTVGEILIKSDCMLEEYHNNPSETEKAFSKGWFRTGDLGFLHERELYVTGRRKELIIVGGENIYPQDIEAILNQDPHFISGRNVAFGVKDDRVDTERIVVLAEINNYGGEEAIDVLRLKAEIFDKLNVTVSELHLLPPNTLKKSTAGKISRHLNKQQFVKGRIRLSKNGTEPFGIWHILEELVPRELFSQLKNDTPLFDSGLLDSFSFTALTAMLEKRHQVSIPADKLTPGNFQTISQIQKTVEDLKTNRMENPGANSDSGRAGSRKQLESAVVLKPQARFWESFINYFPFPRSFFYRICLTLVGADIGRNVRFLGRVKFKIRGSWKNIRIEDNVVLGRNVDLRNREQGKIILRQGVYLDDNVRLVAARNGSVELKQGVEVGLGTVINSGGTIVIGKFTLIAMNVNINSSSHGIKKAGFIKMQAHEHGNVIIEDDVWIGAGACIVKNTKIMEGAVISANSLVHGTIPKFAVCGGVPAVVLRYRD